MAPSLLSGFALIKQKINIKWFMVVYLAFLLIFSAIALDHPERMVKGLAIFFSYAAFDVLWTYARDRVLYFPLSSWISAYVLGVVALPDPPWWMVIMLPFLAVVSKQLLKFGKMRHIFNPASFAMGVVSFFVPAVSWWAAAWGKTPLWIVFLVGLFILWRQNRFHVVFSFFLSYAIFLVILFFIHDGSPDHLFVFLKPQIFDGTPIFFATVMLIEPLTSMFPSVKARACYGVTVGFFTVLVTYLGQFFPNIGDPLVYGLLLGNFVASMIFLPARKPKPRVSYE